MSNPTSNFGWQMPTPTDLVTDLPADFEVFGQAVDSSMADLKGGTTGQILSKATNTDMDFVWITNDQGDITAVNVTSPITGGGTSGAITVGIQSASTSQSGAVQLSDSTSTTSSVLAATPTAVKSAYDLAAAAIPKSTVTAKGSIVAASASSTPAQLAVGNNGETLVADSSTSTGLRYQGSITGGKNFAINGGMDIWQRGTSFAVGGVGYNAYTVDRWTCYSQGSGTIAQDTSLSASGFRYGVKFTSSAASGGNDFYQLVETDQVIPLAGKQVAVSGYALSVNGKTPSMNLEYSTTVNDGLFGTYVQCTKTTISEPTATGSLLRYTYSFAVPTTAKTLRLRASTGSLNNTEATTWTGVQLEVGNVPTLFSRAGGTIQGELAACQRYYWRNTTGQTGGAIGWGINSSTTAGQVYQKNPVTMRTVPTSIDYASVRLTDLTSISAAITNLVITASESSPEITKVVATVASGLTQYRPTFLTADSSAAGYVGFSAEL